MSLKIWITGNGNVENQGCGMLNIPFKSSPVYDSGKLGKCIKLTNTSSNSVALTDEPTSRIFSMAYWTRLDSSEFSNWSDIAGLQFVRDDGNTVIFRQELFLEDDKIYAGFFGAPVKGTGGLAGVRSDIIMTVGEWVHDAITCDGNTLTWYRNDKQIRQISIDDSVKGYVNWHEIHIGSATSQTSMCDFRLYDHCLSKKEIHEIYKSLILHYPLNNPIVDLGENVLTNSWDMYGWTVQDGWLLSTDPDEGCTVAHFERTEEDAASGNIWRRIIPPTKLIPSDYPNGIVVSFDFRCKDLALLQKLNFGDRLCSLQIYNSGGKNRVGWYEPSTLTHADAFLPNGETAKAVSCINNDEWMRMYYYFSNASLNIVEPSLGYTADDVAYTTLSFQLVRAGSIDIRKIKVSPVGEFSHSPYSLNRSDTLLAGSDLALSNKTITDCSGYGNDGISTTSTYIDSNLGNHYRYPSCLYMGKTDYINCGMGAKVTDEITVSIWACTDDWDTGGDARLFSCTENGGWNIELIDSSNVVSGSNPPFYYRIPLFCNGGYYYAVFSTPVTELSGGWHMFAFTFDGFTVKAYLDGKLDGSCVISTTNKIPISYNTSNSIFVHAESFDATTPAITGYNTVVISDFRIYATALTAEDIKELYQTPFSIDKNGNVFGYNFMEV